MTSIASIKEVLLDIHQSHVEMLELAEKKKQILINGHIDELSKIITRESGWIKKLGKLEEKRSGLVQSFLREHNQQDNDTTISELLNNLHSPNEKEELSEIAEKLQSTINQIQELNQLNTQLIQQSLEFVNSSMEVMTGGSEPSYTYSKPTQQQSTNYSTNTNRGFFDKKA